MTMRGIIRHDQGQPNAASLDDFPDDILMEILSRVPAHELVMMKTVCKTWRRLIADRYFARLHLHRATPVTLVLTYSERSVFYATLRMIHDLFKKFIQMVPLPASLRTKLKIVAYCDGLFIGSPMSRYGDAPIHQHFIFNPATGEQRTLAGLGKNQQCAGFYYHPPSNNYRLLCCYIRLQGGMFRYYTRSIIHRMRRRQEKDVGMFENLPREAHANLNLGGFLYSVSSTCHDCGTCIMRFDINKEELQFMPHPGEPCFVHKKLLHFVRMRLMCIQDKLGLFIINQTAFNANVWILEDPSTWSWNRKFIIDLRWCRLLGRFPMKPDDFMSFNDGEYTLYADKGIYHYLLRPQRVVKIHQETTFIFLGNHFKFSLISPRDVF